MSAKQKADSAGPHKILTLDGGGIRGAMTIEILAEIERIVLKPGETLSDYFDYISGTSTGAIIAAGLALGWKVDELREFYHEKGEQMFDKASFLKKLRYKYEDDALRDLLIKEIGIDVTLGSEKIKTLLMMVMRNATTDSPWPISNNPYAKYNDPSRADDNGKIPLWQLIRASTAAPVYFPPECVTMGLHEFLFVDGGITCYNNPSFQTFLMATTEPYGLNWATGEEQMLVVSLGTGSNPMANAGLAPGDMNLFYNASTIPAALMNAASAEQDFLCRVFGNCVWGEPLDREIGDMCSTQGSLCGGPAKEKLFTYVRYNAELTHDGLEKLGVGHIAPEDVQKLDSTAGLDNLKQIGEAVGSLHVKPKHFEKFV